jgi:hypothetical protein
VTGTGKLYPEHRRKKEQERAKVANPHLTVKAEGVGVVKTKEKKTVVVFFSSLC